VRFPGRVPKPTDPQPGGQSTRGRRWRSVAPAGPPGRRRGPLRPRRVRRDRPGGRPDDAAHRAIQGLIV